MIATTNRDEVLATLEQALVTLTRRPDVRRLHNSLNAKADISIDRPGYVTLAALVENGPQRVSDLATLCGVDTSTTSRIVENLVGGGLVMAAPAVQDRRVLLVRATDSGEALLRRLQAVRRGALAEALKDWSDTDVATLSTLLARFVHDIRRIAITPPQKETA